MFPDYIGQLTNPDIADILILLLKFFIFAFVGMVMNTLYVVGSVWWLLFLCRLIGIPWIDGTTKGFVNRRE